MLRARDLTYAYKADPPVITGFNLEVADGQVLGIIGRNGCGKTTLLRLLAGLNAPATGSIARVEVGRGASKTTVEPSSWRDVLPKHVSLVFQDYSSIVFNWQTVEHALRWIQPEKDDYYSNVMAAFSSASMPDDHNRYWGRLSGGQKQAVAVARGLLRKPDVLLLDEPFANLDASFRYQLEEDLLKVLRSMNSYAPSIILVTHDVDEAVFLSDRLLLVDGKPLKVTKEIPLTKTARERDHSFRLSDEFLSTRAAIFNHLFANRGAA